MAGLSVIVVSYKGWKRLESCLNSLATLREYLDSEVIVVDNDSGDAELEVFRERYSDFIFIRNEVNGGFGNGCNLGAKYATRDHLLFLNPDTVASPLEISKLLKAASLNPDFTIISCRQVNERGKENNVTGVFPAFRNLTGLMRLFSGTGQKKVSAIIFPEWISGSVVMISRDDFRDLNGFDEDFWMYYEDVDLCRRASDKGGKIALFRDITIEHNHGGSSRINLKTASLTKTEVYISRHVYISKHKSGSERFFIQVFMVINNLATAAVTSLPAVLLFFVPKISVRAMILFRLLRYYTSAAINLTWVSPLSVNSKIKTVKLQNLPG